ncbi:MAG: hypothetical protein M3335_04970, partial [Actinomycetota bacterium]|nr:hypothetical protein [Actinomycetota bacterium]
ETLPAATPQGLLADFSADLTQWKRLSLVPEPAPPDPAPPSLAFNDLGDDLRQAFQSNELFMVAADGEKLAGAAKLEYWLDEAALGDLEALPPEKAPPQETIDKLRAAEVPPRVGEEAFEQELEKVLTTPEERGCIPTVVKYGAYFEIVVADWRFRVSPLLWEESSEFPTLMIFKFASSKLSSLVGDPEAWTWAAVGGEEPQKTSERLTEIIGSARKQVEEAKGRPHPLDFFVDTVCDDPAWTGVLFLDAQVPLSSLPEELRGLAAGIDASQFRAHHVGLSVSPVAVDTGDRTLSLASSSFFGLIDYDSPEDIAHTFDDFDFKVQQLRVLFRNSAIVDFASRIELFVNRLFGESVALLESDHYNNLILIGSYQRQQGEGHYVFATTGAGVFASQSAVVEEVEITRAQFTTSPPNADDRKVHSRFRMWGRLRFHPMQGFDLFSFGREADSEGRRGEDGYLAFSGLAVEMTFAESNPQGRELTLDVTDVAFDPSASRPRPASFFARFPLTLASMVSSSAGRAPKDAGYAPVETPLVQPELKDGWYGIAFTIDLGTLGALAADAGLVVTLLAAWGPSAGEPAVNVGLRLPGSQSLKSLPAIEGVLQLGFQSIALEASGALANPPDPAYVMRLRRFSLRLLGWSFPPGQADLYLFGDPETGPIERGALGWYAAYLKDGK